jgi:hypothetical protein
MAQHDYDLANASGASFRSDANSALSAIVSVNSGASAPSTTFAYMLWADTTNGVLKQRNAANSAWIVRGSLSESRVVAKSAGYTVLASDFMQMFKCSGTFTLALTAAATLADGFIFYVKNTGAGVITIDPNSTEQIDAATTITLAAGEGCIVFCDGAAFFTIGRPTTSSSTVAVPVRQTVLGGPLDANGLPNFGGSTGSTTVTMSGTVTATAANGFGTSGAVDVVGQGSNLSWGSLSTNGTMYLYVDIAAGALTAGSGTLAPTYQWGGTYSTTSGQFTFNIQEMVGKVGNGATAAQTNRVYVGEVTVAGGVVTAITWYALMGRYDGPFTATLPGAGSITTANHNMGAYPGASNYVIECTSAEFGYSIGDRLDKSTLWAFSSNYLPFPLISRRNTLVMVSSTGLGAWHQTLDVSTFGGVSLTRTSWKYKFTASRGW